MNVFQRVVRILVIMAIVSLVGCWDDVVYDDIDLDPDLQACGDKIEMAERSYAMSAGEKKAWHKSNLYDAATDSYYLPPELFYATPWDGDQRFEEPAVDYFTGSSFCDRVSGPVSWSHPQTGETYSVYRRSNPYHAEYLRLGDQGFEQVFESGEHTLYDGAVIIPSGKLWRIQEPRSSSFSMWRDGVRSEHTQTIEIKEILFDSDGVLAWVVFRRSVDGKTVVERMLEPKRGFTRTYVFDDAESDGSAAGYDCADKSTMETVSYALTEQEKAAWARANLYDSNTDSYYIPPELWTGAVWDGYKSMASNPADLYFGATFCKRISGPVDWTHPINHDVYQIYTRTKRDEYQYFVISPQGVGRVFDSRYGEAGRYYDGDIKFPAGEGWRVGEKVKLPYRQWTDGVIKDKYRQIEVTSIRFDENDVLAALTYRFWASESLDHEYTYMPRRGMAYLYKFSE